MQNLQADASMIVVADAADAAVAAVAAVAAAVQAEHGVVLYTVIMSRRYFMLILYV